MDNHNTVVTGKFVNVYLLTGVTTTTSRTRYFDTVSGHSIVKGDKKKPNSFSYNASFVQYYDGRRKRYENGVLTEEGNGVFDGGSLRDRVSWAYMIPYHYNRALDRLNDKVRGQLDLAVDLAEMHQTKQMMSKMLAVDVAMESLRNMVRSLDPVTQNPFGSKRGRDVIRKKRQRWPRRWNGLIGGLKALGGAWLTWQYGVKPLIHDLYDSVDELYRHQLPDILSIKAKSAERLSGNLKVTKKYSSDPQEVAACSGIQGVEFHMRFKETSGFDLQRWSSLNPVSLAWELLPLSFVADWMYDVGSMLRSLETSLLSGSQFVSGYYTSLYAWNGKHVMNGVIVNRTGTGSFYEEFATSYFRQTIFSRSVLGSYPLPKLPTFRVNLGAERLLTTASLLAQKFL